MKIQTNTALGPIALNNTGRINSIQALRALSALGLVAFHTDAMVLKFGWTTHLYPHIARYGVIGVDVFFVISGFVMLMLTHGKDAGIHSALRFMLNRITRITPLYWVLTALFAGFAFLIPEASANPQLNPWHVFATFVFLPAKNSEGVTAPILGAGWTLNYEIWFYLVFSISMCFTNRRLFAVSAFLTVTSAIGLLVLDGVVFRFYTNPIVLEFVFGCVLGAIYVTGRSPTLPEALAFMLVTAIAEAKFAPTLNETNRFLVFGLPALSVVILGLSLEKRVRWNALLGHIGDSSYSLYLTHLFSMPIALSALRVIDGQHRMSGDLLAIAVVLFSALVGSACYHGLEMPLSRFFKRQTGVQPT